MQSAAWEPGRNSSKNSSSRGHCGHTGLTYPSEHPLLPSPVLSPQSICPLPSGICPTSVMLLFICMGCAWADVGMQRGERCGHAGRKVWAQRWRQKVSALILLQVQISCQSLSILLLCLCFPACKPHEPAWGCSSVAGGQWQSEQGREEDRNPGLTCRPSGLFCGL